MLAVLGFVAGCSESAQPGPAPLKGTFVFSAAGDYGASSEAAATLESIGRGRSAFHLALGDLSYGRITPERAWCDFVRARVDPDFPFQLVAGNHDDDGEPSGQHIDAFRRCLPNRLEGVVGRYATQYYVDYPRDRPLARFILVSPGLVIDGERFTYRRGGTRYRWVARAIDGAREAGTRWVVVGSHGPCLTAGEHGCLMGADLFNLLVDRRVDLIVAGHEHNYQRSAQVAHRRWCGVLRPGTHDADCVVDDGKDGRYRKGAGSVQVITGAAGAPLHSVSADDPEAAYMAAVMGEDDEPTHGLSEFSVSPGRLTGRFVSSTGGDFADRFSIVRRRR